MDNIAITTYDLVIIGAGLAGYHTAKQWRQLNLNKSLMIITEHAGHFTQNHNYQLYKPKQNKQKR